MERVKKVLFYALIAVIFLFGIYLRLKLYLYNRPLWADETYLFDNIFNKGYLDLFGHLSFIQTAPPLFLIIEKFLIVHFDLKEQVLRFFPFICALLSVPLFYMFSKTFFKSRLALLISNLLFAVNVQLIFYSQELKQYSSDVFFFLLLFIILNKFSLKDMGRKEIIIYILLCGIIPLVSLPSYFVIGAWILRELFIYKKESVKKLFFINIPLLIITAVYLKVTLFLQYSYFKPIFIRLWGNGFLSLNMKNNFRLLNHNLNYFFGPNPINAIHFILLGSGIYLLFRKIKEKENLLLFLTIFMFLLCSALQLYPLYERVCLYTLPIIIIFFVKIFDAQIPLNKIFVPVLLVVFALSFKSYNLSYFENCSDSKIWELHNHNEFDSSNARDLMKILKSKYHPYDTIIYNNPSIGEYKYYKTYFNFNPELEIEISSIPANLSEAVYPLLYLLKPNKTYWFFYSADYTTYDIEAIKLIVLAKHKILYQKRIEGSYLLYIKTHE